MSSPSPHWPRESASVAFVVNPRRSASRGSTTSSLRSTNQSPSRRMDFVNPLSPPSNQF